MRIADIQDESINSGVGLLELHGCMVDLRECAFHIKWEKIPLQKADGYSTVQSKMYWSVLDTTVSLSPHLESVAPAKVDGLLFGGVKWRVLEPQSKGVTCALKGLLLERTLVDLHRL